MENNVQEDYKSEILDIVRSNASPGIMRDKLEDYHENDLAEVVSGADDHGKTESVPHSRHWDAFRYF